ncbi:hypothetical protein NDU88_006541 [Pleurodeles waltl]|uniref:Uncharacterized protein n=1 Tax=Pleurodeles waltl TaxID=8319 RepID=A0AAV7SPV3_PLEWA|nr:hypothetical protein NDU88_006541 [Pleurodeles waltl]
MNSRAPALRGNEPWGPSGRGGGRACTPQEKGAGSAMLAAPGGISCRWYSGLAAAKVGREGEGASWWQPAWREEPPPAPSPDLGGTAREASNRAPAPAGQVCGGRLGGSVPLSATPLRRAVPRVQRQDGGGCGAGACCCRSRRTAWVLILGCYGDSDVAAGSITLGTSDGGGRHLLAGLSPRCLGPPRGSRALQPDPCLGGGRPGHGVGLAAKRTSGIRGWTLDAEGRGHALRLLNAGAPPTGEGFVLTTGARGPRASVRR